MSLAARPRELPEHTDFILQLSNHFKLMTAFGSSSAPRSHSSNNIPPPPQKKKVFVEIKYTDILEQHILAKKTRYTYIYLSISVLI